MVVESMVRAGIDYELNRRPIAAPARDSAGTICRRRPIVDRANEDQRGDAGTSLCSRARRVERGRRPEPQTWRREVFEGIGLRHGKGNPGACRKTDHGQAVWIDEGLPSQKDESSVGIRPALEEGDIRI